MARGDNRLHLMWREPDKLLLIEGWFRDGLTIEQIAHNIGIKRITFHGWMNKYPEIAEIALKTREVVDREVENSLFKKAMGFEVEETETIIRVDNKGREVKEVKKYKKYIPPSDTALIYWLKNRKPTEWRDRREVELQALVGFVQIVDNIPKPDVVEAEVVNESRADNSD